MLEVAKAIKLFASPCGDEEVHRLRGMLQATLEAEIVFNKYRQVSLDAFSL